MKRRSGTFNPKRRMLKIEACDFPRLRELSAKVQYGGNPEHKKNPGDFNLTPPSDPRPGKSLCDAVRIFSRPVAEDLLKQGARAGLVSDRMVDDTWPKNIWAVTVDGEPLEAQLESPEQGTYHGYPMPPEDPFYQEVIEQWKIRCELADS